MMMPMPMPTTMFTDDAAQEEQDRMAIIQEERRTIGAIAHGECKSFRAESRLSRRKNIAKLAWEDIETKDSAPLLGKGSYCQVSKGRIECISPDHCHASPMQHADYAIKYLQPRIMDETKPFRVGAIDLAIEGEMLSRLDHKNIIKLHGVSKFSSQVAYSVTEKGYFLVLDVLQETLTERLFADCLAFARQVHQGSSKSLGREPEPEPRSSSDRLKSIGEIAIGIAEGMKYLHSKNIVLRDLKPDNVGFDSQGTPKIFDLGFAREVHTLMPGEKAGSFRYMAPEVGRRKGASLKSDVYSFGVLLWEMCCLKTPFAHLETCEDHLEEAMIGGWRESTAEIPIQALRELIERCWDANPSKRPTFKTVLRTLRRIFGEESCESNEKKGGCVRKGVRRTKSDSDGAIDMMRRWKTDKNDGGEADNGDSESGSASTGRLILSPKTRRKNRSWAVLKSISKRSLFSSSKSVTSATNASSRSGWSDSES